MFFRLDHIKKNVETPEGTVLLQMGQQINPHCTEQSFGYQGDMWGVPWHCNGSLNSLPRPENKAYINCS